MDAWDAWTCGRVDVWTEIVTGDRLSQLPTPRAARLARPRWLDLRLVIGILIVLVSVVLGARLVATVDDTYEVWSVGSDLGARTTLTADDLVPVAVSLGDGARRYLSASTSPIGRVLARPLARGELIPLAALIAPEAADLRNVVIEVDRVSASGLRRGRVVDVYAVPAANPGAESPAPPRLVVGAVTVAAVSGEAGTLAASGRTAGITLLLDSATVPALLAAEEEGRIVLVEVPAGAAGAAAINRTPNPAPKPSPDPAAGPTPSPSVISKPSATAKASPAATPEPTQGGVPP